MPQQLSSKDASLFRQVVRLYENKQYKKGKHILHLLSHFPHRWLRGRGESTALRHLENDALTALASCKQVSK